MKHTALATPPAGPEPATPRTDHAARMRALRADAGARLFDGGGTLVDDDTMRSNWAVPWSDLMMTMFVLFAALLAAQTLHRNADQSGKPPPTEPEKIASAATPAPGPVAAPAAAAVADAAAPIDVLARSQDAVRGADLQNVQIAVLDDKSVKVSVQGAMFFPLGKAELRPEVMQVLDGVAKVIKDTPYDIHVVGHTDDREISTGLFPSNWELSLARASRVAHYLIEAGAIDPARFTVIGRGQYHPLSPNTDDAARALNRRVEIVITRSVSRTQGEDNL